MGGGGGDLSGEGGGRGRKLALGQESAEVAVDQELVLIKEARD